MKVLIINGSPRKDGNSSILIKEATNIFDNAGVEYEIYQVGGKRISGCIAFVFSHRKSESA